MPEMSSEAPTPEATVYDLVDEKCTSEQISNLFRDFKEVNPKEVLVSGSKVDLLGRLRRLVSKNIVPIQRVVDLLRECEENGDQHIFYLKPRSAEVVKLCRDGGDHFASSLWGEEYDYMGFPSFDRIPQTFVWSDFRAGLSGKPKDWLAKIYGHEVHDKFKHEIRDARGDLIKYYLRVEDRPVCLVRWNDPDLLELRIPRATTLGTVRQRLETVWEMMRPAFDPSQFEAWDMDKVRRKLLSERGADPWQKIYRLSSMEFIDSSSGRASFLPHTDDENADDAIERTAAIDAYLTGGGNCHHLVVTWLPKESAGKLATELKAVSGGKHTNELVIAAKTTFDAIDYVTNRLRELDRD